MASCVFNTLLPIYMVTELKSDMRALGVFEGLLEGFSYTVRMFSGEGRRLRWAMWGGAATQGQSGGPSRARSGSRPQPGPFEAPRRAGASAAWAPS